MEKNWDNICMVTQIQAFLDNNKDKAVDFQQLAAQHGYSKVQMIRIFRKHMGMTPAAYLLKLRMTEEAVALQQKRLTGLEAALNACYQSQEGYIKAFRKTFGVTPNDYTRNGRIIPLFKPSPLNHYYMLRNGVHNKMEKVRPVTVQIFTKEAHKIILRRGIDSTDYFSYCEEIGCDIWGILDSIAGKLEKVAFTENLPVRYIKAGTSRVACFVEVKSDYNGPIPADCDIVDLPACDMAVFQGMPFEDPDWFPNAHEELREAIAHYHPERFGYRVDFDAAPERSYAYSHKEGYVQLIPLVRLHP